MINYLDYPISPYKGIGNMTFGAKLYDIKAWLKKEKIPYVQSIDLNKGCVPEIPWTFIVIYNSVTLCFVYDILFQIVLENQFEGVLPNGGHLGMLMTELEAVDPSLEYNDDEEDYYSEDGYWVTDDIESGKVTSITIFVPEIIEENFFEYKWIEKYL